MTKQEFNAAMTKVSDTNTANFQQISAFKKALSEKIAKASKEAKLAFEHLDDIAATQTASPEYEIGYTIGGMSVRINRFCCNNQVRYGVNLRPDAGAWKEALMYQDFAYSDVVSSVTTLSEAKKAVVQAESLFKFVGMAEVAIRKWFEYAAAAAAADAQILDGVINPDDDDDDSSYW